MKESPNSAISPSGNWWLISLEKAAVDPSRHKSADERRQPEEPELLDGPPTDEQGRCCAACGIDGCVGDGDADQVDEGQCKADSEPSEPGGRASVGRAENHNEKHERHHNLCDERGEEGILAWRVFAVAVSREPRGHEVEARLSGR